MNPHSPIEETKTAMCLSPQEKLKSAGVQRNKRSHAAGVLAGASDVKKARLDDIFKNEFEMDLDGWISDDYLRAVDFDDRLNQDIDWVAHDEMDLALSMDALAQDHSASDDVNDFGFGPSFLRGGLAFEDPAEMASTFVDPAYIRLESKDAEKLLMSFDTMNFKIPSPTSASGKKRTSIFSEKEGGDKQVSATSASFVGSAGIASSSSAQVAIKTEPVTNSSVSISASANSLLSVLNVGSTTLSSSSSEKKIGSYSPAARKLRLQKFHEKRKNRTWKKSIKYDCRKKLADDRPRIKGRFVRVLENSGDAKTGTASRSVSPPNSGAAGYASPTSPTGAMAPPVMAHPAKPQMSRMAAASFASTLASGMKQSSASMAAKSTPVTTASASNTAALPFVRMIASV